MGFVDERVELLAPVPTIAIGGGYAFTDRLFFSGSIEYLPLDFALDDEEDLKGDIGNVAGIDSVRYEYYGPAPSVAATF